MQNQYKLAVSIPFSFSKENQHILLPDITISIYNKILLQIRPLAKIILGR